MIKVTNLTFSYGEKPLFDGASFTVAGGQRVGLVGPNGSGKTTLFKLLTQKEQPGGGKIEILGNFSWVPQEVKDDQELEESASIRSYLNKAVRRKDFELKKMLGGIGLSSLSLNSKPNKLSGGEKTKLALARALLSEPEILLLDEPTNFMDLDGKKWVIDFLSRYQKTLILVSHDLKLMGKAIDKVLYLNQHTKKIDEYKGNYTKFTKLKAEKEALLKRQIVTEQKRIKRMEESVRKLYRHTSKKGVRQRIILQRRVERAKQGLPGLPKEIRRIKIKLPIPFSAGELPLQAKNISKSFGKNRVFKYLNFSIIKGERIVLIGPNGAGKTTLIKILIGLLKHDTGEVIKSPNLKIGYYSQEFETFDLEKTLLETFMDDCRQSESFARPFLGRFNFLGNKVFQKIGSLSGGEKTRFVIALLAGHNYNLLILDEPTTYLDTLSQRVILEALKEYQGTMIIVSHTQEFIAELNPNKAFLMPENKLVFWSPEILNRVEEV